MIPATQTPMFSAIPPASVYFESKIGEPGGGSARGSSRPASKPKKGGAKKGGSKKTKKPGSKR